MKKMILLQMLLLSAVCVIAENHRQQTEFELNEQLLGLESYRFEASSYIKLLDGFKYTPENKFSSRFVINRYGVFPPDAGFYGGPSTTYNDGVVGALPGSLNVSDIGCAIYSIPIQLPKGIGDMAPDLAITYNNQAGNGLLGWAWNLSGLSSIARVGKTKYHDGTAGRVKFNNDDRFALDGKRLMLNCQLQYGEDGATYRTEIDDMTKIVSHTGNPQNGPEYFTVYKPDGTIWEYGSSADTYILPQNASGPAMSWLVSKISDRDGNSIVFHYDNNNAEGESYISLIEYTLNETHGVNAMYEVSFSYENRYDSETYYIYQNEVKIKKILKEIQVKDKSSSKELLRYTFDYYAPALYDWVNYNYNRLKTITLVADGMKMNPTVISWNDKKKHFNGKFQSHTLNSSVFNKVPFVGDFNGDGFSDVLLVPYKSGNGYQGNVNAEVYINNTDGTFESTPRFTFVFDKTLEWVYVVDFDGDGLADVVPYFCNYEPDSDWRSRAKFYKNNGDVSFSKIGNDLSYDRFFNLHPGDFCGEHRTSFYLVYENPDPTHYGTYYPCIVYIKNGVPYQQTLEAVSYEYVPNDVVVLDMDGDGKQEVMYVTEDKAVIANLNYVNGFYNYAIKFIDNEINTEDYLFPGDFNGDGNVDLLRYNQRSYWKVIMSDGKQFHSPVSCLQSQLLNGLSLSPQDKYSCSLSRLSTPTVTIRTADFDGDGKCDVAVMKGADQSYMLLGSYMYKKGSGEYDFKYTNRYYLNIDFRHNHVFVGNFLGQENQSILGSVDVTQGNTYFYPKIVGLHPHSAMYSVERITDGVGNAHGFAYDYLMPKKNNSMYSCDFEWIGNDIRTIGIPIRALKSDTVFTTNGTRCYKKYSYENIWYHTDGRGSLGIENNGISTFINGKQTQRKLTVFDLDTDNQPVLALPAIVKLFDSDDAIVGMEMFEYENFVCADNPKIVMPLQVLNKKITYNFDRNSDVLKVELTNNEYVSDAGNNTYYNYVNLKKTTTGVDEEDEGNNANLYNYQTCTEYTYNNNVNLWIVNRIKNLKYSSSSQNGDNIGHCESFVYDNTTNPFRVVKKTSMPNLTWNSYDPLTVTTNYEYDVVGNIVGQIQSSPSAAARRLSSAEYSSDYNYRYPTAFVNEKGWRTSMRYSDCFGLSASTVDYNDFEMNTTDDILGLTSVCSMADGVEVVKTKRWAKGHKHAPNNAMYYCWEKSTGKAESMIFYHKNGNQLRNVTFDLNGQAIYVDMKYDDYGNLSARSLPYRNGENVDFVYFIYDKHNRIIEEIYPNGLKHEYSYGKYSKTMTTVATDGSTQSKTEVTNEMGWVVETVDVGGNKVNFDYYSDGLMKSSQIGSNSATKVTFEYDHLRNKSKIDDPSSGTIRYEYDAFGNLLKTKMPHNKTISCDYDEIGQMILRRIDDGDGDVVETQWIYDNAKGKKGMLRRVSHGNSHVTDYLYDDLLHLVAVNETIDGVEYVTSYEYDQAGRESRKTYPTGFEVENHYSNSGFLKSISDAASGVVLWKTNTTDALGNVTDYQVGNGLQTQLGYDEDFKYLKSIYTRNDSKLYQNLTYSYDEFGNMTNRTKHTGTMVSESFEYDDFNRLVGIKLNGNTTGSMVYDQYGNMTDKTINGVSVFYEGEYNGQDPYAIRSAKTEIENFDGLSQRCTYTAFNKLQNASNGNATISFEYDADMNRDKMRMVCDNVVTNKTYVGDCEFVEKNNVTTAFTFLSGPMGVFAVVYDGDGVKRSVFYIHKDHLDSWCLITDENANLVQETSYDAWGNPRSPVTWSGEYKGELLCDRGFTGHEHILALGLINMNGRVYDPMMSMMLSPDSFIQDKYFSQNYNRYRYCYNNPLSYNDPSGEIAQWIIEGFFWGVVNVISNLDVIDDFWEGAILFAAGFAYGALTHGLGSCAWVVQVVCGVGASVIQAGVNNFVTQNDGSYDWNAIDKASLKEDIMYSLGYGLVSSTLNAYIVHPTDENPGVCLGTLICEDYKRGHILETTVGGFVGNFFAHKDPLENIDWASLGIEWGSVFPSVLSALQVYYPNDKLLTFIDGIYDIWGFIYGHLGGQNGNNGGSDNGSMMNAIRFDSPMICRANLDAPACYSNVRSLILNK